jgi:hypothetical protein
MSLVTTVETLLQAERLVQEAQTEAKKDARAQAERLARTLNEVPTHTLTQHASLLELAVVGASAALPSPCLLAYMCTLDDSLRLRAMCVCVRGRSTSGNRLR